MSPRQFGAFSAVVPPGWTVGEDGDLIAVHPPGGEAYLEISVYVGPDDARPSAADLCEFAEDSFEAS
jgi:hypothetical protein